MKNASFVLIFLFITICLFVLATPTTAVCVEVESSFDRWSTQIGSVYATPNGTNISVTCIPLCADTTGGCASMTGCSASVVSTISGATYAVVTNGPNDGTTATPIFCGGQSCKRTAASGVPTITANLSIPRTNLTGTYIQLACRCDFTGCTDSTGDKLYIASPGNPNLTSFKWYDGSYPATNGSNQSSRNGGNLTCFESPLVSDGTIVNTSLWANFSANGSNSTTFRLIDKNVSAGLTNSTARFCVNLTNALNGATNTNNVSVALCANTNTTTGGTTRYGMSCKSLRGPTWITSGTSMSTANSVGTFNWFNVSWPNAAVSASNPCQPVNGTMWNITTNLTCVYTDINNTLSPYLVNVSETGSLAAYNLNLRTTNVSIQQNPTATQTLLSNTTLYLNDGNFTISNTFITNNVTIYANGSYQGRTHINVTATGNWTAASTQILLYNDSNYYLFMVTYGGRLNFTQSHIDGAGYLDSIGNRGLELQSPFIWFSRVNLTNNYNGLYIWQNASGINLSHLNINGSRLYAILAERTQNLTLEDINTSNGILNVTNVKINDLWLLGVQHVKINRVNIRSEFAGGGDSNGLLTLQATTDVNISNSTFEKHDENNNGLHCMTCNYTTITDSNITGGSAFATGLRLETNGTENQFQESFIARNLNILPYNGSAYDLGIYINALSKGRINNTFIINSNIYATTTDIEFTRSNGTTTILNTTLTDDDSVPFNRNFFRTSGVGTAFIQWPMSVYIQDTASLPLATTLVYLRAANATRNESNITGAAGYVRYLNFTEYYYDVSGSTFNYVGNYTLNASKSGYDNASVSLNISGPNETTITLVQTVLNVSLVFPMNNSKILANWTVVNWTFSDGTIASMLCNVTLNQTVIAQNVVSLNGSNSFTLNATNLTEGRYNWTVLCRDSTGASHLATNAPFFFTVTFSDWELGAAMLFLSSLGLLVAYLGGWR